MIIDALFYTATSLTGDDWSIYGNYGGAGWTGGQWWWTDFSVAPTDQLDAAFKNHDWSYSQDSSDAGILAADINLVVAMTNLDLSGLSFSDIYYKNVATGLFIDKVFLAGGLVDLIARLGLPADYGLGGKWVTPDGVQIIVDRGVNSALIGSNGIDNIYGYDGNDHLSGGKGDDRLYGGEGQDELNGGKGDDTLIGGGWLRHRDLWLQPGFL